MALPGFGHRPTPFDDLPPDRWLDEQAPIRFGTIDERAIALVRPERYDGGPRRTIPITMSRLRRDADLRRGLDPGPFVPSLTGIDQHRRRPSTAFYLAIIGGVGVVAWLVARD